MACVKTHYYNEIHLFVIKAHWSMLLIKSKGKENNFAAASVFVWTSVAWWFGGVNMCKVYPFSHSYMV